METEEEWANDVCDNFEKLGNNLFFRENQASMKCVHVNIRSCKKNWDAFQMDLTSSNIDWDIIALTEVNLKENELAAYEMLNYEQISVCRKETRGGGVIIYIKKNKFNNIVHESIKIDKNDALDVTFKFGNDIFNIVVLYRKPASSRIHFIIELKKLLKVKGTINNLNIIFMGDLNLNILKNTVDTSEKFDIEKFENLVLTRVMNNKFKLKLEKNYD